MCASRMQLTEDEAIAWLSVLKKVNEAGDSVGLVALFSDDVTFRLSAFGKAFSGREQLHAVLTNQIFEFQRDIYVDYQLWGVRDNEMMVRWTAGYFWVPSNTGVKLDGVLRVAFRRAENGGIEATSFERWFDQVEV